MLSGSTNYTAIAQFGRDQGHALTFLLGFRRGKTPTKSSLSALFRRLDISAREAALSRWVASRLPAGELHVCLDGKTLRGPKMAKFPVIIWWPHTPPTRETHDPADGDPDENVGLDGRETGF